MQEQIEVWTTNVKQYKHIFRVKEKWSMADFKQCMNENQKKEVQTYLKCNNEFVGY